MHDFVFHGVCGFKVSKNEGIIFQEISLRNCYLVRGKVFCWVSTMIDHSWSSCQQFRIWLQDSFWSSSSISVFIIIILIFSCNMIYLTNSLTWTWKRRRSSYRCIKNVHMFALNTAGQDLELVYYLLFYFFSSQPTCLTKPRKYGKTNKT